MKLTLDDLKKISFNDQSQEWVDDRKTYIGGTDISTILGYNPYKTERQLFMEKKGQYSTQINEAMVHGLNLEPYIAKIYKNVTGHRLYKGKLTRMKDKPFLAANPDYKIPKIKKLVEIKTAGFWAAKEFEDDKDDGVPMHYLIQCQWQMAVCGYTSCDLVLLLAGQEIKIYTIEFSKAIADHAISEAVNWWEKYILTDYPPPISDRDRDLLQETYPEGEPFSRVVAPPFIDDDVKTLINLKETKKEVERQILLCENRIKDFMQGNESMETSAGIIFWKNDKNGTRRFTIKGDKNGD